MNARRYGYDRLPRQSETNDDQKQAEPNNGIKQFLHGRNYSTVGEA